MTIDFHDIPFGFYIMLSIIFWVILEIVYVLLKSDLVEEIESEDKYQINVYTHDDSSRQLTSHLKYLLCYIFYLSLIVFGSIFSFFTDPFPLKMVHYFADVILLFVTACVIWDSKNRLSHWCEKVVSPLIRNPRKP
ncbi:MAG: hypothetical protein WBZ36_29505 [Candidatus Nitrosopolaris sp.]